ncbi:MAG: hypothetical protein QMD65_00085 [Patescibacteria group bacterium]|nr:hypothetical protein [Patescibacteria group bacterium]
MIKENSDFILAYFKDDHGRILRVRIHKPNMLISVSVFNEKPPRKKGPRIRDMVHVYFPKATFEEVKKDPGMELGTFEILEKEAKKCSITRRTKRARKFPV